MVAGLEPENTNTFLQLLAKAASDPAVDGAAAVQKVLGGSQIGGLESRGKLQEPSGPSRLVDAPVMLPRPHPHQ